ncbi:uncharacterized protein LOC123294031 [Chrysoperla carnea]|uniref:uncharacterized protein LOC123294031 n=1 Tax=Chrysoperla carnea TaxID=189513 RepID=UPI001D06579C|nr:uncharacterized protein LOC123294031 [Chrysoperla carnea]
MVFKILILAAYVVTTQAETHSVSTSATNVNGVGHSVTNTDGVVRGTYSAPDPYTGGQRVYHYGDIVSDSWNPWQPVYPSVYPNPIQHNPSVFPRYPAIPPQASHVFPPLTRNYPEIDQDFINPPFWGNNFPRTQYWQSPQYPTWY